jgi:hypothetical protein
LGPGEERAGDVVEALLPHACGLLRGGGAQLAEALRAWGAAAAADARAATRAAVNACLLAAGVSLAGASRGGFGTMHGDGAGGGGGAGEAGLAEALQSLPAEVFAKLLDGVTAALGEHFGRAVRLSTLSSVYP